MNRRQGRAAVAGLTAFLTFLTLSGCSTDSGVEAQGPGTAAPSSSSTPSPPGSTDAPATPSSPAAASESPDAQAILSQYRAFFGALTPASKVAEGARYEQMKTLAVDPALRRVMGGMAASDAAGEVGYGETVVHPKLTSVQGDTAVLTDCQDGSQSGRMKASTGEKTTVGTDHDFANVTMKRGADGAWRVATVEYRAEDSCTGAA